MPGCPGWVGAICPHLQRERHGGAGSCAVALALHRSSNRAEGQHIDGVLKGSSD